jgi:hypothetical protein
VDHPEEAVEGIQHQVEAAEELRLVAAVEHMKMQHREQY